MERQRGKERKLVGREDSRERGRLKRGIFPLPITLIALSQTHIPLSGPFITLSCSPFPLSQSELVEGIGRLQNCLFESSDHCRVFLDIYVTYEESHEEETVREIQN